MMLYAIIIMLRPGILEKGDIVAMDRAYIDYEKFEALTQRDVIYVTKMKNKLRYEIMEDSMSDSKWLYAGLNTAHCI